MSGEGRFCGVCGAAKDMVLPTFGVCRGCEAKANDPPYPDDENTEPLEREVSRAEYWQGSNWIVEVTAYDGRVLRRYRNGKLVDA